MAKAFVGPTGYGTFGIVWRDFPYMENRGGYSGPFGSESAARLRAALIAGDHGETLEIVTVENDGTHYSVVFLGPRAGWEVLAWDTEKQSGGPICKPVQTREEAERALEAVSS